jgi:hypothetical protein
MKVVKHADHRNVRAAVSSHMVWFDENGCAKIEDDALARLLVNEISAFSAMPDNTEVGEELKAEEQKEVNKPPVVGKELSNMDEEELELMAVADIGDEPVVVEETPEEKPELPDAGEETADLPEGEEEEKPELPANDEATETEEAPVKKPVRKPAKILKKSK